MFLPTFRVVRGLAERGLMLHVFAELPRRLLGYHESRGIKRFAINGCDMFKAGLTVQWSIYHAQPIGA